MSTATRAARSANPFNWKVTKALPGSPVPYITRRRKVPSSNGNRVTYYEGNDSEDDDFEVDEETIVVDQNSHKKRKVINIDDDEVDDVSRPKDKPEQREVITIDDDSDDDIPLSQLTVTQRSKQLQSPQPHKSSGDIFQGFPTEIHQHIADFLSDDDVCSFACICESTRASITPIVWKRRYDCTFDQVPNELLNTAVEKYKSRRLISKKWICFDLGKVGYRYMSKEERQVQLLLQPYCLKMLRSLIIESDAKKTYDEDGVKITHGLNFQFIHDLITGRNGRSFVDIIDSIFSTEFDKDMNKPGEANKIVSASVDGTLIYAIQLCLTHISLNPRFFNAKASHFDISQYQAYSTPARQPIFVGQYKQDVNLRWLLHTVNFFKHHLTVNDEGLLAHYYEDLEPDQVPQLWEGRIKAGTTPLQTHWKGAYTFMDHVNLVKLRKSNGNKTDIHIDDLDIGESIQDMAFFFDEGKQNTFEWPAHWESIVNSDPFSQANNRKPQRLSRRNPKEVKKPEVKQFWGTCRGKAGHFFGRLHAMTPQQGIHGFQRLTMIKFYTRMDNGVEEYDPRQVWAFEGCVLPGARIVIGRWWDSGSEPDDITAMGGPFIWWNVDRSAAIVPIRKEEALEFLDSFVDSDVGVV